VLCQTCSLRPFYCKYTVLHGSCLYCYMLQARLHSAALRPTCQHDLLLLYSVTWFRLVLLHKLNYSSQGSILSAALCPTCQHDCLAAADAG
jgi:hypothetical protein